MLKSRLEEPAIGPRPRAANRLLGLSTFYTAAGVRAGRSISGPRPVARADPLRHPAASSGPVLIDDLAALIEKAIRKPAVRSEARATNPGRRRRSSFNV
jgi:hypothetical protein